MEIEAKINDSLFLLERILALHKNPVIACSFGKDSEVALHLVRQVKPDVQVVFNNTKVEFPETYQLKRQLVKDWNLNLVEIFPLHGWTFWKVIEKYGFPVGQRFGNKATGKCCYYLKKAPMLKAIKEYGWDLVIDGMTIYESRQRFFQIGKTTQGYRYVDGFGCHKLSPIWNWTPDDVWDYIEMYHLPYNRYYDNEVLVQPAYMKRGHKQSGYYRCLRVGCWCCTIPLKYDPFHLTHLRMFYPKLYQLLLRKGLAQFLLDYGDGMALFRNLQVDWIINERPCYFEGVTVDV